MDNQRGTELTGTRAVGALFGCEVGNRGSSPDNTTLDADLPAPLTIGGRGLPLIGALADTAAFVTAAPGRVLLRITKHLTDPRAAPIR
ncbi:hypothetical protein [Micromonospora carbonacea]|uniref:Uncharacterized protein n=1 Tax=Micromonospora carbonacea TaxID=47853 RepID=A0A1C4YGU7_9ACTN|nr:hypothetical protein [Micromonospora carbonacea]SCF19955.1 hypothetical protein GA0070563_106122 [Micromonospora carbonacea]